MMLPGAIYNPDNSTMLHFILSRFDDPVYLNITWCSNFWYSARNNCYSYQANGSFVAENCVLVVQ